MRVLLTALAVGMLAIGVPAEAQDGRFRWDRGRVDRGREARGENRASDRGNGRHEPRAGIPDNRFDRRDRRDPPRVEVRPPSSGRYENRQPRVTILRVPPRGRDTYRYGDRDFRHREIGMITSWFRRVGPPVAVYGYHDRWPEPRYVFRPGLYLAMAVYTRLDLLPFDLEVELGLLPWYLERRLYGRTILVIDTRSRMIVDIYEIDY